MPKIKSFEEACQFLGIAPNLPEVSGLPEKHQKAIIAHYKLVTIAEALNEGWVADYSDVDEKKYYSWFVSGGGGSLVYDGCGCGCSRTNVGARLSFKTRELAEYAGSEFIELYNNRF